MTFAYEIKEKKHTQQLQTKDGPINKRSFKTSRLHWGYGRICNGYFLIHSQ